MSRSVITVLPDLGPECCGSCAHWQQDPVYLEGDCARLQIVSSIPAGRPVLRPMTPGGQPLTTDPTFGCPLWQAQEESR